MQHVRSDAELRALVIDNLSRGVTQPVVGLLGGDLMRTLGGSADPARLTGQDPIPHLPIDIVHVATDDGRETYFVAHLVARKSWWWGPLTAAMNAQFRGRWDVSPRAHPNDGRFDLVQVDGSLDVRQRWMARSRLPLGTQVPHPSITIRQHAQTTVDLWRRRNLWVDAQRWGTASTLHLTVHPDAIVVCV